MSTTAPTLELKPIEDDEQKVERLPATIDDDEILFDDTDDVEEEDEIMQVSETQTSLKPAVDPPQTTVTTTQKPVIDMTK